MMRFPNDRGGAPIRSDSVMQRARAAGLSPYVVYGRLQRGWSMDAALNTPAPIRDVTVTEMARRAGLKPDSVLKRMRRSGMTVEQAIYRLTVL